MRRISPGVFGLLCCVPALVVLVGVVFLPLARTILMSFQHYVLTEPESIGRFAGLQNYQLSVSDSRLWSSLCRSLIFTGGVLMGQLCMGLGSALLLHLPLRGQRIWRTLILLPWILPQAQIVLLSIWMFQPEYGIINWLLGTSGKVWINSSQNAMLTLIVVNVYRGFPFMALMFLAGLQAIPLEEIEAALVDGANSLQRFWYITMPHLKPVLLVVMLTGFIWYMPHFTTIWVLTQGGPIDATHTLAIQIYQTAFQRYDFGTASAQGVLWLLLTLLVCVGTIWLFMPHNRQNA
jgi:multiple sugar transport system permease protein